VTHSDLWFSKTLPVAVWRVEVRKEAGVEAQAGDSLVRGSRAKLEGGEEEEGEPHDSKILSLASWEEGEA
jgi:hypothetical protein